MDSIRDLRLLEDLLQLTQRILMALEAIKAKPVKPFSSKSFYLDLIGFNGIKSLSDDILLLGGTLEQFLSKDVGCVITNRPRRRPGQGNCTSTSNIASPRHLNATPEPKPTDKKPSAKSTVNKDQPKPQVLSRGLEILKKAAKVGKGNCNVLDNAEKWGIEIKSLSEVQAVIEKYKAKLSVQHQMHKKDAQLRSLRIKELKKPYIKFEAVNRQFRPSYMEFSSWPVSVFSSEKNLILKSLIKKRKSIEVTNATAVTVPNNTKSKKRFCEICCQPYNDMNMHLKSEHHRNSLNKGDDKYAVFDSLISERFNLDWYLNDVKTDYSGFGDSFEVELVSPIVDREDNLSLRGKDLNESSVFTPDCQKRDVKWDWNEHQEAQLSTNIKSERKRSIDCVDIEPNTSSNKKNKTSVKRMSCEKDINELVDEMCLTVSFFDPENKPSPII